MILVNFIWQWGATLLATLICAWCISRGGRYERLTAITLLTGWYLSVIVESHGRVGPGIWFELIDYVALFLFILFSLKSRALWLVFIAACQLDVVAVHLAEKFVHYGKYPYAVALGILGGYGYFPFLIWGVLSYRGAQKRSRYPANAPNVLVDNSK